MKNVKCLSVVAMLCAVVAHAQFVVETVTPTNIGGTSATLNGVVNTQGIARQCQFQVNPGTGITGNSPLVAVPGSSIMSVVWLNWSQLSPGATVSYQLVCQASSSGNLVTGGFRQFVTPSILPPSFTANQVQSGDAPALPGISPGQVSSIYGSNLAVTSAFIPQGSSTLPTTLAGASVSFNGAPGYLSYASPGQINVQAPFGLNPGVIPVTVTTDYGGGYTLSSTVLVQVLPVNPGISGYGDFAGHDLSQPGAVLPVGSAGFTIWAVGLGAVTGFASAGVETPSAPYSYTASVPAVTVDNEPVTILFSGLAPGWIGLYQVNVAWVATSGTHIVAVDGIASFAITVE